MTIDFVAIKAKLDSMKCLIHNEPPKTELRENNIGLACCCDEFYEICKDAVQSDIVADLKGRVGHTIGETFRNFKK